VEGYPQLTAEGLNHRLAAAPPDQPPVLTTEVDDVVAEASGFGSAANPDRVAEPAALWAALLEGSCPACNRIRGRLSQPPRWSRVRTRRGRSSSR
jgi:hypothetical protein